MSRAKGILQTRRECYLCREWRGCRNDQNLELHHIFPGSRRAMSDKTGCVVYLCRDHHQGNHGAHHSPMTAHYLMWHAQDAYEKRYGHEDFMAKFGKNYKAVKTRDLNEEENE